MPACGKVAPEQVVTDDQANATTRNIVPARSLDIRARDLITVSFRKER